MDARNRLRDQDHIVVQRVKNQVVVVFFDHAVRVSFEPFRSPSNWTGALEGLLRASHTHHPLCASDALVNDPLQVSPAERKARQVLGANCDTESSCQSCLERDGITLSLHVPWNTMNT
ncbi:hypothetical protein MRX96_052606 [Rhipicephalus microplus]